MTYQIWFNEITQIATFVEELDAKESAGMKDMQFSMVYDFEADTAKDAEQQFAEWCTATVPDDTLERVNLVFAAD